MPNSSIVSLSMIIGKKKPKFSRKMEINWWNRITTTSSQLLISIFTLVFYFFPLLILTNLFNQPSFPHPHTSIFYIYTYLVSIIYIIINWSYISTHFIFTQEYFRNSFHQQDSIQLSKLFHERKNEKKRNQLLCVDMSLLNVKWMKISSLNLLKSKLSQFTCCNSLKFIVIAQNKIYMYKIANESKNRRFHIQVESIESLFIVYHLSRKKPQKWYVYHCILTRYCELWKHSFMNM